MILVAGASRAQVIGATLVIPTVIGSHGFTMRSSIR